MTHVALNEYSNETQQDKLTTPHAIIYISEQFYLIHCFLSWKNKIFGMQTC